MEWCIRMIERIRAAIPKELLIEEGFARGHGGFASPAVGHMVVHSDVCYKIKFLVKLGDTVEPVGLGENGSVMVGVMVSQLLDGLIKGYEHLGEKNPFRS